MIDRESDKLEDT